MTINDELWNLIIAFRAVRIETARLDAELLLMHVLDLDRIALLTSLNEPITPDQRARVAALANRRLEGEPVAYIIGRREFFGLDVEVTPDVLIPRPETETLVEWALEWLDGRSAASVVDVGTGSGAIAIALAANTPGSVAITATDISPAALDVARGNCERLSPGRIRFIEADLLASVEDRFDLILANLPYLTPEQIATSPSIATEPRLALDGGPAGTDLIERLLTQVPGRLSPGGALGLELDPSHAAAVAELTRAALPGYEVTIRRDLAGLDRFVLASARA